MSEEMKSPDLSAEAVERIARHCAGLSQMSGALMDDALSDAAATLRALSAELTAAREALAWRTVDSAPHETLVILGWDEDGVWKQEIGLASAGERNPLGYSNRWFHVSATHWMLLPPAPTAHDDSGGNE